MPMEHQTQIELKRLSILEENNYFYFSMKEYDDDDDDDDDGDDDDDDDDVGDDEQDMTCLSRWSTEVNFQRSDIPNFKSVTT